MSIISYLVSSKDGPALYRIEDAADIISHPNTDCMGVDIGRLCALIRGRRIGSANQARSINKCTSPGNCVGYYKEREREERKGGKQAEEKMKLRTCTSPGKS